MRLWVGLILVTTVTALLGGCQAPLWQRDSPHVKHWTLPDYGTYFPQEVWVEESPAGQVLCVNYLWALGSKDMGEPRWQHWRYRLSDGQVLEAGTRGQVPIPTSSLGDYGTGYPSYERNPNLGQAPLASDYFARAAEPDVEIVSRATGRAVYRIPGTEVYQQDGKGELLLVLSRIDHGPKDASVSGRGVNTYLFKNGKAALVKHDMRILATVLRAGDEPVVSRGGELEPARVWFGDGDREVELAGTAVLVYKQWLVTLDRRRARLYVWDGAALRSKQ